MSQVSHAHLKRAPLLLRGDGRRVRRIQRARLLACLDTIDASGGIGDEQRYVERGGVWTTETP